MNDQLIERLVISFERVALATEGLRDEAKKAGARYWPPQKDQREAIVTRIESDQEKELRQQGARRRTIQEVVDPNAEEDDEDYIGARTRQWIKYNKPAKPKMVEVAEEKGNE